MVYQSSEDLIMPLEAFSLVEFCTVMEMCYSVLSKTAATGPGTESLPSG